MIAMLRTLFLASLAVAALAGTTPEGLEWLANNLEQEGVQVTDSGLQYKVIKAGTGRTPQASTPCKVHYEGRLIDGTVFDSSYHRGKPATFAPNQVIKGWTEAMQMMKEGDEWEVYIKSELAYGDRGAGGKIKPGSALIFKMHLIEVEGPHVDL